MKENCSHDKCLPKYNQISIQKKLLVAENLSVRNLVFFSLLPDQKVHIRERMN